MATTGAAGVTEILISVAEVFAVELLPPLPKQPDRTRLSVIKKHATALPVVLKIFIGFLADGCAECEELCTYPIRIFGSGIYAKWPIYRPIYYQWLLWREFLNGSS